MIIHKQDYVLDVNIEDTSQYSKTHSLCDCAECRNFYAQIRDKFPNLKAFLDELGVLIDRPDEISSKTGEDCVDYHFVSYTIIGNILKIGKYEIDMFDGGRFLNIVIDNYYIPNEQKNDRYFTVTVYNVQLPWVLNEPFPESKNFTNNIPLSQKIKNLFC